MAMTLWFDFRVFLTLCLQSCSFHFDHSDLFTFAFVPATPKLGNALTPIFVITCFPFCSIVGLGIYTTATTSFLNWLSCFAGQLQLPPCVLLPSALLQYVSERYNDLDQYGCKLVGLLLHCQHTNEDIFQ